MAEYLKGQTNTQSMTHPYWNVPPLYQYNKITQTNHFEHELGFRNPIPVPYPATIGSYMGSNEMELGLPKQLDHSGGQPEYFARGGYIPAINNKPLINIYLPMYNFSREEHIEIVR
jgi:hypothetical protein